MRHAKSVGAQPTALGRGARIDATDLEIGDHFKVWCAHRQTLVTGWGRVRIGDRVFINSGVVVVSVLEVTIGNDVAIANEAYIMDTDSHGVEGRPVKNAPVRIGDGSWIGARAMILPGVTIAGVDVESQALFRDSLVHLVQEHHAAVLLVSHELGAVADDLDHVVVLKRRVLFDGKPSDLAATGVSLGVHRDDLPLWLEELV